MAFFSIQKVAIRGIAAAVPKNKVSNFDLDGFEADELKKLVDTVGIEFRREALPNQCASDLCLAAVNKLIDDLKWNRSEIDALFFVSQTPDHILPGSSIYMVEKLGLPKSCISFDINQGCAGYVYGLSVASAFMSASGLKKCLLLVGDTITKLVSPHDRSLRPIFSDCGTATALEFDANAKQMTFNTASQGADYNAIIVPEGAARNPYTTESFNYVEHEAGIKRQGVHLAMRGLDVFNFSLKQVAPNVEELLQKSGADKHTIDYFIFHQANRLILESISTKLKLNKTKVPTSLREFGNTSGATIPLTIVAELSQNNRIPDSTVLVSGFGVGLSLASGIIEFKNVICPQIIEL